MSSKVYANAARALDGVLCDGMTIMAELRSALEVDRRPGDSQPSVATLLSSSFTSNV